MFSVEVLVSNSSALSLQLGRRFMAISAVSALLLTGCHMTSRTAPLDIPFDIEGIVTTEGEMVPGAEVIYTSLDTTPPGVVATTTDLNGRFRFRFFTSSREVSFSLTVNKEGFASTTIYDVWYESEEPDPEALWPAHKIYRITIHRE